MAVSREKRNMIKKLNRRIKDIGKYFGKDPNGLYGSINIWLGEKEVLRTEKGNISTLTPDYLLENALDSIGTVTSYINEIDPDNLLSFTEQIDEVNAKAFVQDLDLSSDYYAVRDLSIDSIVTKASLQSELDDLMHQKGPKTYSDLKKAYDLIQQIRPEYFSNTKGQVIF